MSVDRNSEQQPINDFTKECGCRYEDSGEGWNWIIPCEEHRDVTDRNSGEQVGLRVKNARWWQVRRRIRERRWRRELQARMAGTDFQFMGKRDEFMVWDDVG